MKKGAQLKASGIAAYMAAESAASISRRDELVARIKARAKAAAKQKKENRP